MLKDIIKDHTIILASSSSRRQRFLKNLNIDFEIRLKEIEENYPNTLIRADITDFLAKLKAKAFEKDLKKREIIITSDTIVWHENKALGKPKDYNDAYNTLESLSGKTHEVITSVCLKSIEKTTVFNEITKVTFITLTDEEIHYYLKNYKPFDKAGAYGIQEWIGLIGVSNIEGSYTNIVGLPIQKFYQELTWFILNQRKKT